VRRGGGPGSRDRSLVVPAVLGLVLAMGAFRRTMGGPRHRFWDRMTLTGFLLGGWALATSPPTRRLRSGWREAVVGFLTAGLLYGLFRLGDGLASRLLARGNEEIAAIYALGRLRPRWELALRIGGVIGPSEELFWRGQVQSALMERLGRVPGTVLTILAYALVHLPSRNRTLVLAAAAAGTFWGVLYAVGVPLGALVVSHVAWDLWIFLVAPTREVEP
jgi:membrane protease YdiL (CAAX protease family)